MNDEFAFLPQQAQELGASRPLPPVRRLHTRLPDGRELSALRFGARAPEVVFLHGAGLNAHTWDTTVLACGLPSLTLDLPGHGDSSWRDDADYAPRTIAADVAGAVADWTHTPPVIVGHSLGGMSAAALCAQHPDLARALILVDITPGIDPGAGPAALRAFFSGPADFASRDELVERALAFGLGGTREAAERGVFLNSRVRDDGRVEWKHHAARLIAQDPGALAPAVDATGWDDLAAVMVPTMLVRGERGFLTDQDVAAFRRHLPSARVESVAASHNVQEEAPIALAALVREMAAAACAASS